MKDYYITLDSIKRIKKEFDARGMIHLQVWTTTRHYRLPKLKKRKLKDGWPDGFNECGLWHEKKSANINKK